MARGERTLKVKIVGDSKGAETALGAVGGKAKKLAKVGGAAAVAMGTAFAVDGVRGFLRFDDKMNQSLAIMGNVSGPMRKQMEDAAKKVGLTTRLSSEQAAESYFYLASAGMDAKQSVAALPQVAAFAQAGMFDMSTATDLATDAQSALGLSSQDAGQNLENLTRVTDVFVRANTLANTSVQQVAEAMTTKAGAAMRSVGIDIEQGTAVLAAFADQGVKGNKAGTQFAIVLRDLQTKALANKDAFAEAGVAVFDANGEMRHMGDIVADLEGYLGGMTDAQKKAALATMGFSDKSMGALTTLLGTSDAIKQYDSELRNATGYTRDVAGKQMESYQAKLDLLKSRFDAAKTTVGQFIVEGLFKLGPELVKTWNNFTNGGQTVRDAIGKIKKFLGDAVKFIKGTVIPAIENFYERNKETFDQIRTTIKKVMEAVKSIISGVIKVVKAIWDRWGTHIKAGVKQAFDSIMQTIRGAMRVVEGIIDTVTAVIKGDWSAAWAGIKKILSGALTMITGAIKTYLLVGMGGLVKRALGAVLRVFTRVLGRVVSAVSSRFGRVVSTVRSRIGSVKGILGAGLRAIRAVWNRVWGSLKSKVTSIFSGIRRAVSGAIGSIRRKIEGLLRKVRGIPGAVGGAIASAMRSIPGGGLVNRILGRWHGGSVSGGTPYIVGEKGPEMFVPHQSGRIVPRTNGMGGGGVTIAEGAVSVTVHGNGNPMEIRAAVRDALGEVVQEIRSGRRG